MYERLWCVHEVDEALTAEVRIHGLFDTAAWSVARFRGVRKLDTKSSQCSNKEDADRITQTIEAKEGGFGRLDGVIAAFRSTMLGHLRAAIEFEQIFGIDVSSLRQAAPSKERTLLRGLTVKVPVPVKVGPARMSDDA